MMLASRSERRPRQPDGVRIYAVSDMHGCADVLRTCFGERLSHVARGAYRCFLVITSIAALIRAKPSTC
jgi:hypothetical protein